MVLVPNKGIMITITMLVVRYNATHIRLMSYVDIRHLRQSEWETKYRDLIGS